MGVRCADVGGVDRTPADLVGICAHRYTEGPREPEVRQLQVVILVNQQILGLQIPVEDPVGVTIIKSSIQLVGEFL